VPLASKGDSTKKNIADVADCDIGYVHSRASLHVTTLSFGEFMRVLVQNPTNYLLSVVYLTLWNHERTRRD
jgi:hypothetical protein